MHDLNRELIEPIQTQHLAARQAQKLWSRISIRERLKFVRKLRWLIAAHADELAQKTASVRERPVAEKLVSEVLPLADACRWLEREASGVLAARSCANAGRPLWMRGLSFEVQRQPFGVILVIGPGNYPLFLPVVHALHALVAGNAVLLKPAPGTRDVAQTFAKLAYSAGLAPALLTILEDNIEAAQNAINDGPDKVIFTGSSENGRDVLAKLANTNTPAVMELSGEDVVLVLDDADLDLVLRALRFGTHLNGGDTCMAPRRIIAVGSMANDLCSRFAQADFPVPRMERVASTKTALELLSRAHFALGVSIFSRHVEWARALAAEIPSGFVLINDLIVPTADPRMPFCGARASGFGVTRGAEGLLEVTYPHVVAVRRGKSRFHFDEPESDDGQLFSSYIRAVHGRGGDRPRALRDLIRAFTHKIRNGGNRR